jgi:hypothetical protein
MYKLELSPDLRLWRIHDTFHEKLLKAYVGNNDEKFPKCETHVPYDIRSQMESEAASQSTLGHW